MLTVEKHGIPPNPYNPHAWVIGNPKIGKGTWIGAFCLIDGMGGLEIGKGCDVSCGAHIVTHTTVWRCVSERKYDVLEKAPVKIGDFVFIGENATILKGSVIGHHSIIGAGAVVTENSKIPPYSLVLGVPGKVIRQLTPKEIASHVPWAKRYRQMASEYKKYLG